MEKYSKRLRNTGIAITIVLLLFVLIGMTGESSINELDVYSQIGSCETNKGIFLGDISKGVPNGTDTFYNLDGSEYEGAIVNGLKEGKGTTNQEERKKAYAEWQLKFSEDVPYILLGNAQEMFASNSRVKGYNPSTYIDWTHDVYKLKLDNNK